MGGLPDLPGRRKNLGFHARRSNQKSGGSASISTNINDPFQNNCKTASVQQLLPTLPILTIGNRVGPPLLSEVNLCISLTVRHLPSMLHDSCDYVVSFH